MRPRQKSTQHRSDGGRFLLAVALVLIGAGLFAVRRFSTAAPAPAEPACIESHPSLLSHVDAPLATHPVSSTELAAFSDWGETDLEDAIHRVLQRESEWPARRRLLQILAAAWVNRNLPAALAALDHLPESESKDELRLAMGNEVAGTAPREALRLALEFPANAHRDALAARALAEWAAQEAPAAAAWTRALPAGEFRDQMVSALCPTWADSDALAAAEFALQSMSAGDQQDRVLVAIVQRWAQRDPATSASIVAKLPVGDVQDAAIEALIPLWLERDPSAVTGWLHLLPPGQPQEHGLAFHARLLSPIPTTQ